MNDKEAQHQKHLNDMITQMKDNHRREHDEMKDSHRREHDEMKDSHRKELDYERANYQLQFNE